MAKQALVVTTEHRGVFFGYGEPTEAKTIRLENCRMCLYWPESIHGVVGLASGGPQKGAKIGPAAPAMILQDITSIMEASPIAIKNWEKELWT